MGRIAHFKLFGISFILIFLFLAGRLFQLQVVDGQRYADLSERNAIRLVTVPAPRGIIFDAKRRPVVASRMAYRIFLDLRDVSDDPESEYAMLTSLLGMERREFDERLADKKRRAFEPVVLMNDADAMTVSRILEHKDKLPGVTVEEFPTRQYVYRRFASHVVGYLSEINADELAARRDKGYHMGDLIGKSGVERVYEEYLRGIDGGLQVEVNNLGEPIRVLGMKEPVPGNDVVLTIDQDVQMAAQNALREHLAYLNAHDAPNADAGAVIAMDPRTGRIIAMVSWPDYDPNIFVSRASRSEVAKLFTDPLKASMNRAVYGVYPYGSTFKIVTATAALEEKLANTADRWYCNGYDPVNPRKKCWTVGRGIIHGTENLIAGIRNSCNIVFYDLGRRLGPDRLAKWARAFGFGSKTGIELLGESAGLVPDRAWKKTISRYPWYPSESMDFGIGQGYMGGTPLQLARAYSALVNGGILYQPQIVKEVLGPDGKPILTVDPVVQGTVPYSPERNAIVREGLEAVVREGTAKTPFRGFALTAGGKTGTAQNSHGDNHGWFAGYAPADKPEIVVVVLVERGKSGASGAAPIGRKVMDAYFGLGEKKAASGGGAESADSTSSLVGGAGD